jgi:hypothetical protein
MNPCHPACALDGVSWLKATRPCRSRTRNEALCLRVLMFSAADQHVAL